MNQLKRFYNQNRKMIWGIIIIITFLILILQIANYIAKQKNERDVQNVISQQQNNQTNTQTVANNNIIQTTPNYQKTTIEKFISYCNEQKLEDAYNMITDDCKKEMFNDIQIFASIYYNSTFENQKKEATIEKWEGNTYIVKLFKSALSTGKIATAKEEQKIDYITVVKENDNYKLNINSYIGYKKIAKTKEQAGVKIEVLGKHVYLNYELYNIKVVNTAENEVILDSLYNTETMYLKDSKGVKYTAYSGELSKEMITIESGHTKQVDIKFAAGYVSNRQTKELVFSEIKKNRQLSEFVISL